MNCYTRQFDVDTNNSDAVLNCDDFLKFIETCQLLLTEIS